MKTQALILLAGAILMRAEAQNVVFDFDNAPLRSPLPVTLTVGGVTAEFTGTGQSFSIQPADTMGFTPAGFSGNCVYPSSIYAADLIITFSTPVVDFSVLYAPEEYGCDTSATMRVTAYRTNSLVGTATTNAQAGTWPSATLRIGPTNSFDKVVVHYDAPPSGENWGPIFMADNVTVTPEPTPVVLDAPTLLGDGSVQLTFSHMPGGVHTVLASTNAWWAVTNWTELGSATEVSPGQYLFIDTTATNKPVCFYCVRTP